VNRSTLTVLKARSEHRPLRAEPREPGSETAISPPQANVPVPAPGPAPAEDGSNAIILALLLLLLALGLGVITGLLMPELRRPVKPAQRPHATPTPRPALSAAPVAAPTAAPGPAPAPRRPPPAPKPGPAVLGYAVVGGNGREADAATAALALRCARRGWSLIEVIHDGRQPGRALTERPGLAYALEQIRSGIASGLVVARLRDLATHIAELATLLRSLGEADAFLGAADDELDTSTRAGKATARAVIELGAWERRLITQRTRDDLAYGRFTPRNGHPRDQLTRQVAAMQERGISMRAIADALNLAGISTPEGRRRWQTTDVRAAAEEVRRT
jgi:DNA invertase Pin-like site-specific DNA recombinase